MQEIVNYLVENPDVLEKVVSGHASVVGLQHAEDMIGLLQGILNTGKTVATYWI
ncbi:competence pheromone ComX [Metabacillus sp. GX 13764]|uniref:competence pheromone ComX n=1 Tax=Metabacillus kandeliae TaxID=2900151 RepID=UPI001E65D55E|nr:competence pheromone ComX [Metabacillus kandeliae]MCD7035729.1 competence pheromone ComX [Metabacillus kandeliae]